MRIITHIMIALSLMVVISSSFASALPQTETPNLSKYISIYQNTRQRHDLQSAPMDTKASVIYRRLLEEPVEYIRNPRGGGLDKEGYFFYPFNYASYFVEMGIYVWRDLPTYAEFREVVNTFSFLSPDVLSFSIKTYKHGETTGLAIAIAWVGKWSKNGMQYANLDKVWTRFVPYPLSSNPPRRILLPPGRWERKGYLPFDSKLKRVGARTYAYTGEAYFYFIGPYIFRSADRRSLFIYYVTNP